MQRSMVAAAQTNVCVSISGALPFIEARTPSWVSPGHAADVKMAAGLGAALHALTPEMY